MKKTKFLDNIFDFIYHSNKPKKTYIYFIVCHIGKHEWQNRVKIGISQNPHKRLKSLQTGNPNLLKLWYHFEVDSRKARRLEKSLHSKFKWSQSLNEWFTIHKNVRDFVNLHKKEKGIFGFMEGQQLADPQRRYQLRKIVSGRI